METVRTVQLESWAIIVNMAVGGDHLAIQGAAWGHPKIPNGDWTIPGIFVSFDRETMTGVSRSGTRWHLPALDFRGNGNARTLEDAIRYIEKNWVVHV